MAPTSEELRRELAEIPQAIQGAYSRFDRQRAYDLEQRRSALPGELSVAVARENLEASESELAKARDVLADREQAYSEGTPAYEQARAAFEEAQRRLELAAQDLGRDELLYARGEVLTAERQVNQAREHLAYVQQQQQRQWQEHLDRQRREIYR